MAFAQRPQRRSGQPTGEPPFRPAVPSFQAVTAVLTNPYASYISPHYAQAYAQGAVTAATTADGYTLSSTYVPSQTRPLYHASARASKSYGVQHRTPSTRNPSPSWYQPGNHRCAHEQCRFTGSRQSLEIHQMDRHLIYPPDWNRRKPKNDWDADPVLKGKPIPIQGTNIVLDNPEVLDKWLAERKKRWPTRERVLEKKRKLEEAAARGELAVDDVFGLNSRKRRHGGLAARMHNESMSRGSNRGRKPPPNRRTSRGGASGQGQRSPPVSSAPLSPQRVLGKGSTNTPVVEYPASDSDSDDAPEEACSKPAIVSPPLPTLPPHRPEDCNAAVSRSDAGPNDDDPTSLRVHADRAAISSGRGFAPRQPRKTPRNPLTSRPNLLRSLLLPEIRMTVSNLSQAIRFLVENDFLRGVEITPGQADEKMIEVIASSELPPTDNRPAEQ